MRSSRFGTSALTGGLLALGVVAADFARAAEITAIYTVALRFDPAPGTSAAYSLFNLAFLNDAGELLFWASIDGGARGLWWWTGSGDENLVALEDAIAPGFASAPLETIGEFFLNANGPVFFGQLDAIEGVTSVTDDVVYASPSGGALDLIAREGSLAPGLGGATFGTQLFDQSGPVASDFGTLFANRSEPPGGGFGDDCLWRSAGGAPTLLAIEDEFAPGVPGDAFALFQGSVMNDLGVTLTHVRLESGNTALYSFGDGAPDLVVLAGDAAPGTGVDHLKPTENRDALGINNAGQFAYISDLVSGTAAVFAPDGAGGTRALMLTGDPAPGTPGAIFDFPRYVALGADGSVVMEGSLEDGVGGVTSTTRTGIWGTAGYGPLQLIARRGDQPAGLPPGSRFETFPRYELNGSGEVIISGTYVATGGLGTGDGLWHHDLYTGVTSLLMREGHVVEVAPGDSRTVNGISALGRVTGGEDGRFRAWNDAGQLAATLTFDDATRGAFRFTVPEPGAGATGFVVAALAWLARRRA
jgi:hypothetical protein